MISQFTGSYSTVSTHFIVVGMPTIHMPFFLALIGVVEA